ncbi:hypothetical protein PCE1_003182 [Barthelona sp. PCE]
MSEESENKPLNNSEEDKISEQSVLYREWKEKCASKTSVVPVITNMVGKMKLKTSHKELDLPYISTHLRNADYQPTRFNGCFVRFDKPKGTILLFRTKVLLITGCKTAEDAYSISRRTLRLLRRLGYPDIVPETQLQFVNISAKVRLGFPIDLSEIASDKTISKDMVYNPDINAALYWKMKKPKVTMVIYASGAIIFVGARSFIDILKCLHMTYVFFVKNSRDREHYSQRNVVNDKAILEEENGRQESDPKKGQ